MWYELDAEVIPGNAEGTDAQQISMWIPLRRLCAPGASGA